MERSSFADEHLVALLYLFFALEALLSDTSEGRKAHGLAFRQATLGHVATEQLSHPDDTLLLYGKFVLVRYMESIFLMLTGISSSL
jgi:hypothetical protein